MTILSAEISAILNEMKIASKLGTVLLEGNVAACKLLTIFTMC